MKVYNVEIFDKNIDYKDSVQITEFAYQYDYLDIDKSKVTVPAVKASKGDYIRITSQEGTEYNGIISDIKEKKNNIEISYKPFMNLTDVKTYVDMESYKDEYMEEIIGNVFADLYIQNEDVLQNVSGMEVSIISNTVGILDFESGIINLYEMILDAFETHGIVCEFSIDVQRKKIVMEIGKCMAAAFTIESDLPNILEKEIIIKEAKESTNKLIIYNEADFSEKVVYYKNTDDEITTSNEKRVYPVIQESVTVKVPDSKTFEDVAKAKAESKLKASKYDNNIEITVEKNDLLVRPGRRKIGQEVNVISGNNMYKSILTGIDMDENVTLIFGSIRLELTKILKRRFRNGTD